MRNFQDTFETHKGSFISTFSICMTVPLRQKHFGRYNAENCNFPFLSDEGENCFL